MKRFEPERDTIFVTLAGSRAHGTAHAGSDVDLRGVGIAPLEQRLSYRERFEQYQGPVWQGLPEGELVIYDVAKFVRLLVDANPNALEILFSHPDDWILKTPAWERIHDRRRLFLSRKVEQTYLGYALAQLRRIRTHRAWLLEPPEKQPTRADFGLPEKVTLADFEAERRYRAAARHWDSYQRWKRERNPARAELEAKFGYDTKHAMHLVRLMRIGLELLETGELSVRRADAEELVAIRQGALSYDELLEEAERLRERMDAVREESPLPEDVDHDTIDALLFELVARA